MPNTVNDGKAAISTRQGYLNQLRDKEGGAVEQKGTLAAAKNYVIRQMTGASLKEKADAVINAKCLSELAAVAAQRRTGSGGTKSLKALAEYLTKHKHNLSDGLSRDLNHVAPEGRFQQRGLRHLAAHGVYEIPNAATHKELEKHFEARNSAGWDGPSPNLSTLRDNNDDSQDRIFSNSSTCVPEYVIENMGLEGEQIHQADSVNANVFGRISDIPDLSRKIVTISEGSITGGVLVFPDNRILKITSQVGKGGYGSVVKCTDPEGKQVAVKIMKRNDPLALNEVNNTKILNHDNIPRYHDCAKDEEFIYLEMDLVEGSDFTQVLKRGFEPPLADTTFKDRGQQLVSAMQEKTRKELYVCDLKPGNIMLDQNQQLKLIDHGGDVPLAMAQKTGAVAIEVEGTPVSVYTPVYAVPEQLNKPDIANKQAIEKFNVYATCGNLAIMRVADRFSLRSLRRNIAQKQGSENEPKPKHTRSVLRAALNNKSGADQNRWQPIDRWIYHGIDPDPNNRPNFVELHNALGSM